jgi:hypothetical protein
MPSPNPAGRKGKEQGADRHAVPHGQNHQATILRRIKRDHPDIADRLERGEFKSAPAGPVLAGFFVLEQRRLPALVGGP